MKPMPNAVYDILKWLVLCVIPALTTFFCVIDKVFGWGYAEIVATISAAFCTCLGTIIGISTAQYNQVQGKHEVK